MNEEKRDEPKITLDFIRNLGDQSVTITLGTSEEFDNCILKVLTTEKIMITVTGDEFQVIIEKELEDIKSIKFTDIKEVKKCTKLKKRKKKGCGHRLHG